MKVSFHKKFLKDLTGLPPAYRKRVEMLVFRAFPEARAVLEVKGVEKLKGHQQHYKIRVGDYRVGFEVTPEGVTFERVLHRKEIYRYFPIE